MKPVLRRNPRTGAHFDYSLLAYSLLDCGDGRRLERFGALILDRPCPSAAGVRQKTPKRWQEADTIFVETPRKAHQGETNQRGHWKILTPAGKAVLEQWECEFAPPFQASLLRFALKGTPFGHIGMFPEQAVNWQFLLGQCTKKSNTQTRVLNLFAYTGGSTLAAAAAGAAVTHVDSAKSVVQWARRNAELSNLADRPIRWIVEDARKFVAREIKRENHYDHIVLDPPSYGHGTGTEIWQITRDLAPLLQDCYRLLTPEGRILLTCHSPGYDENRLASMLNGVIEAFPMQITAESGGVLPCGIGVRTKR